MICSVHTPSAKLFSEFDHVYVISAGQCTYQGYGPDVIYYLKELGFNCPNYFNPADFGMISFVTKSFRLFIIHFQ